MSPKWCPFFLENGAPPSSGLRPTSPSREKEIDSVCSVCSVVWTPIGQALKAGVGWGR